MTRSSLLRGALAATFLLFAAAQLSAQSGVTATGALASSGDVVTVPVVNLVSATVQLTGTWSGVPVFEATTDGGVTWWPLTVLNPADGSQVTSGKVNGLYLVQNTGYTAVRVRASDWSSGTATVTATRGYGVIASSVLIKGQTATGVLVPVAVAPGGVLATAPGLPLPACNAVLKTNCK